MCKGFLSLDTSNILLGGYGLVTNLEHSWNVLICCYRYR